MNSGIQMVAPDQWEQTNLHRLHEMPYPPEKIYYQGTLPDKRLPLLSVVGSRKYTTYGKQVVEELVTGLSDYEVGIVSGLAIGIDALAHEAAMEAGLYTVAIPGSGLDESVLYPARHRRLARRIIASGGGLLSELPPQTRAAKWTFPKRNRLMAGLSHATLLIEAQEQSGTLITARLTVDYDRELLVVPGSIFAPTSRGVHQFLKLGATPVTSSADIAAALSLQQHNQSPHEMSDSTLTLPLSDQEQRVLAQLDEPLDVDTIARRTSCNVTEINVTLMHLEINGQVRNCNGLYQRRI